MSAGPRVLLMQLSERTSAKGNAYLSGWLGKASVVAFPGEPDKHGNATWDLFVSTPEPRPAPVLASAPGAGDGAASRSAQPEARGSGWRGSQYRRPRNGASRVPAGDGGAFLEDTLDTLGRAR